MRHADWNIGKRVRGRREPESWIPANINRHDRSAAPRLVSTTWASPLQQGAAEIGSKSERDADAADVTHEVAPLTP